MDIAKRYAGVGISILAAGFCLMLAGCAPGIEESERVGEGDDVEGNASEMPGQTELAMGASSPILAVVPTTDTTSSPLIAPAESSSGTNPGASENPSLTTPGELDPAPALPSIGPALPETPTPSVPSTPSVPPVPSVTPVPSVPSVPVVGEPTVTPSEVEAPVAVETPLSNGASVEDAQSPTRPIDELPVEGLPAEVSEPEPIETPPSTTDVPTVAPTLGIDVAESIEPDPDTGADSEQGTIDASEPDVAAPEPAVEVEETAQTDPEPSNPFDVVDEPPVGAGTPDEEAETEDESEVNDEPSTEEPDASKEGSDLPTHDPNGIPYCD